jgi:hypothetical protein
VLGDTKLIGGLAVPFEDSPFEVVRLSCEKVLFGRADPYSSHPEAAAVLVPFDAQPWLRLRPRR